MNDAHLLKDVLRQYEGQEAHTMHLVYTPKNRSFGTMTKPITLKPSAKIETRPTNQSSNQTTSSNTTDALR